MKHTRKLKTVAAALAIVFVASGFRYTGFNDPAAKATAQTATNWLLTQQQSDGGFEVAGFPGFETSNAVLAIAENAQTKKNWNPIQARLAVLNATENGNSALDALDDFADAGLSAGQAAKLIVLVADPLRFNARRFDPQNDGDTDLRATMEAGLLPDGSFGVGQMNATLYAVLGYRAVGKKVPAQTLTYVRNAQEASGGWDFSGDASGNDADVDTTALAIQALVAARVKPTDPDLLQGLAYLANEHQTSGAWLSFGGDDPNSTAVAMFAITAAGFDPTDSCWRDAAVPALEGQPYASPSAWLISQQDVDGHIISQFDFGSPNTFATSQSIQALRRGYLPLANLNQKASVCS